MSQRVSSFRDIASNPCDVSHRNCACELALAGVKKSLAAGNPALTITSSHGAALVANPPDIEGFA
jgi:hypothetical protein